jgi:hypothetical protein
MLLLLLIIVYDNRNDYNTRNSITHNENDARLLTAVMNVSVRTAHMILVDQCEISSNIVVNSYVDISDHSKSHNSPL